MLNKIFSNIEYPEKKIIKIFGIKIILKSKTIKFMLKIKNSIKTIGEIFHMNMLNSIKN